MFTKKIKRSKKAPDEERNRGEEEEKSNSFFVSKMEGTGLVASEGGREKQGNCHTLLQPPDGRNLFVYVTDLHTTNYPDDKIHADPSILNNPKYSH